MEGVVGQMVLHGANNMGQRIQTDDIRRAIGTRFGSPKTRAGQLVYQFVRQAEFLGLGEYRQYAADPDTVAHDGGGVFGAYAEIGRAAWWERVCQYVEVSGGDVTLQKKKKPDDKIK